MSKLVDDIAMVVYKHETEKSPWDGAEEILALVREALLSNEVQAPIRQELHDYPRTSTRDTVKTVIEMALDAITTD